MGLYGKITDIQKLREAWRHVRKNQPAPGVDGVTWDRFDANVDEELKTLYKELMNHTYEAQPVKIVTLHRNDKSREIGMYCMRDKVVQQSAAVELGRMYDYRFSDSTYAYRSNKSALSAVSRIDDEIRKGCVTHALKVDIRHFFDCMQWAHLEAVLRKDIDEDDVIALLRDNCASVHLDTSTGELVPKEVGIYQGSGISPILSNIYLMEFDQWLKQRTQFFIRYSDDMLILGDNEQDLQGLLAEIRTRLNKTGLEIHPDKSQVVSLREGVNYLGYHFDQSGKSIPVKAEENLAERLETMWITSGALRIEDKLAKAAEITGGWEQYFRSDREIATIYEFCAAASQVGKNTDRLRALASRRPALENYARDIMQYLAAFWRQHDESLLELLEYEQYYQIPQPGALQDAVAVRDLLGDYRSLAIVESAENALNVMQDYSDLKSYENASWWMKRKDALDKAVTEIQTVHLDADRQTIKYNRDTAGKILRMLAGRDDVYGKEMIDRNHKRITNLITKPLTEDVIMRHLSGVETLGSYIQRSNATVHYMVIDIDISKRTLLSIKGDGDARRSYLERALAQAQRVEKELEHMGLRGYIEYSGYRGFHVWLFLTEWMPVRYANMLQEVLEGRLENDADLTVEYFPNKTHIKAGKFGQSLKLPFGVHLSSGERSYFYDEGMNPVVDVNGFLDGVARFTIGAIKKAVSSITSQPEERRREVSDDLSVFGELPADVSTVLGGCTLMRYLALKAKSTCYLSHCERQSVLYVFGHLGENGQQFVHQVMSYTLNYNYNTTERFIRKCPESPVSCQKLREQYGKVTAEIGCNCHFKLTKNCYPSPVLHAVVRSEDVQSSITLPVSKRMTEERRQAVIGEINVHARAQECAKRMLELKRQERSLRQSVRKVERELQGILDSEGLDSLEIESGVLMKRPNPDGSVEWVIAL